MPNPRKPTPLKIVEGTARADRLNPNEPKPPVSIPSCPSGLSAGAKAEWRRIAPALEDMGLLSQIDRAALAGYCELYARWQKAEREIQKPAAKGGGEVVTTPNGSLQVSPWVSISRAALSEMRKFASEFGLTPASRSKVSAEPPKKEEKDGKGRFFK